MSFKPNKSKFKVYNKPKATQNQSVKLPVSIAATALSLTAQNISYRSKEIANMSDEESSSIDATKNRDTSSFYAEVFKRGINTLRPEIVMINEYSPIVTGRSVQEKQNSISVQYGNNTFVEVTNTARLLELHQMLKENAINTAEILIKRYTSIPSRVDLIINNMSSTLKSHINEIYDINLEKMRTNLLNKTFEKVNNVSIKNQINQLTQETLVLVSDYVMNDYIAQKIMSYIAKIFDFKESIESSIELNRASKVSPTITSQNSKSKLIKNTSPLKKVLSPKNLLIPKNRAQTLSSVFSNSKNILNNFASNAEEKKINPSKESNFENFLDITNYLRSLVFLNDTITDIENESHDNNSKDVLGSKKGNLGIAINNFKSITFAGCFGSDQRKTRMRPNEEMLGDNINDVFNDIGADTNYEAFSELMAAMCYDQVSGATEFQRSFNKIDNDLSNGKSFITLAELFEKEIAQQLLVSKYKNYFNNLEKDNDKVGNIVKKMFKKRQSPYDAKTFIPFETNNTIASEIYNNNEYFPAEEIYFTSALKNKDNNFQELENFITEIKSSWEQFSENIIKSLGLDFDDEGKKTQDSLNTVDQLNPISYLNYYLNLLADDLEANYIDSGTRRKKSLVGLSLLLNNADSMGWTVSSFKSTLLGALINEGIGAPALLSNQNSENWIEGKGEGVINTLYSETEKQVEKSFRRLLDNINVTNYPKGKRSFPDGGDYSITLTATGLFDGTLGTFKPGVGHFVGVSSDDHVKGEPDDNFKRYNYGHSGAADVDLTEMMNLKVTTDWLGPVIAIAVAVLVIGTLGIGVGIAATAAGITTSATVIGAAIAGTAAATMIGAGITSAVTAEAVSKSDPVGIQITSSGLYTFHTIVNSGLIASVNDKENLHMPNITEETVSGSNLYFFRNAQGNGKFKFIENDHPGNFGGLRNFSAVHRSFLFHYFAVNLLSQTQRIKIYTTEGSWPDGPDIKISFKISRMRGLIAALRNEEISSSAVQSEKQAYQNAKELISEIKNKIIRRKEHILGCLSVIDDKISSLENTHKKLKNFLTSTTNDNFAIIRKKLEENQFFEKTSGLLTPSYKDYLAKSYFQNYVRSDARSSLFAKYDKDDLNDLKIMYRVLTAENYGFLEKEKFGRKNVYHVGIPIGMIDYLRREGFKETGDEDYLDSTLICITLYKNNQLNPEIDYVPKQFIFDMSKHIFPCTYNKNGSITSSNHIKNSTDDKNLEKIIKDMEIFIFNDDSNFGFKSNGSGYEGIVGNRTSKTENNYGSKIKRQALLNHIFDYYLKMYTKLTAGFDVNESTFLLNSENIFSGQIDNQTGNEIKNQIYNRYLRDYPGVANDATQREIFSRSINLIASSVIFSSNNRLKEMMSMNCFERIFSILVNDKDFIVDTEEDGTSQLYENVPILNLTGKLARPKFKANLQLDKNSKKIKSYIKENQEKSTSMSGFSVEIGILKKW